MYKYYIAHKGKRIGEPMTKEEALKQLFELRKTFKHMSVVIYDEKDRLKGQIPKKPN